MRSVPLLSIMFLYWLFLADVNVVLKRESEREGGIDLVKNSLRSTDFFIFFYPLKLEFIGSVKRN